MRTGRSPSRRQLIVVILGYDGYRLLTRGEKGSGLDARTAIAGEG